MQRSDCFKKSRFRHNSERRRRWFMDFSKMSGKYRPPFTNDPATPLSRGSMMMYSEIKESLFAQEWTGKDQGRLCPSGPVPILDSKTLLLPRTKYFFRGCFCLRALQDNTLTSHRHVKLGQVSNIEKELLYISRECKDLYFEFSARHDMVDGMSCCSSFQE